jgi:hypothetical protein
MCMPLYLKVPTHSTPHTCLLSAHLIHKALVLKARHRHWQQLHKQQHTCSRRPGQQQQQQRCRYNENPSLLLQYVLTGRNISKVDTIYAACPVGWAGYHFTCHNLIMGHLVGGYIITVMHLK